MYDDVNLQPGERLLWSGKPERHPLFEASDTWTVLISLPMLGFAVLWTWNVLNYPDFPWFFMIFGGLFVLQGLYYLIGRPIVRMRRLRSTRYTVTSLRLVEIVDWPRRKQTEAYLRNLQPPVYRGDEMIGSVAFGEFPGLQETIQDMNYGRSRRRYATPRIILRQIAQPRYVRDIIASAQSQRTTR